LQRDKPDDDNRYLRRELRRPAGDDIIGANFRLKAAIGIGNHEDMKNHQEREESSQSFHIPDGISFSLLQKKIGQC
jgi:hypothetical protein